VTERPAPPLPGQRSAAGPARRPSRAPRPRAARGAQVPYIFALAIAVAGLAWMWEGSIQRVRGGTLALAGAMLIGALARLALPEERAGMLASRRRFVDVVTLAGLAIGLLVAGLLLPSPS
jgi:peptidoglycan/LPS O-acetylase OafA/YrhL